VKKDFTGFPFLQELAEREEMVRNGKLTVCNSSSAFSFSFLFYFLSSPSPPPPLPSFTFIYQSIIFIRDKNNKGQEISGYIDYAHRLKTENFEPYFERKKRLLPRSSDLSFYNWETQTPTSNSTPNFQVIADNETGLLFKNKRDRKVINVDPKVHSSFSSLSARFLLTFSFSARFLLAFSSLSARAI
jgi:Domain of unknown function (DUF4464)